MQQWFERIRDAHNVILVSLLFAACLALMLYIYPREGQFKYEFSEGRVWQYEDFFAPFDLEVEKLDSEVAEEQQAIREQAPPVYLRDTSVSRIALERIESTIRTMWDTRLQGGLTDLFKGDRADSLGLERHVESAAKAADAVLRAGIIDLAPAHEGMEPEAAIRVSEGAYLTELERRDLKTLAEAAQEVRKLLEKERRVDREFLEPILQQHLSYNLIHDREATERFIRGRLNAIQTVTGKLEAGELIVRKGEQIGLEQMRELKSVEATFEKRAGKGRSWWIILLGQALLIGLGLLAVVIVLRMLRPEILDDPSRVTFMLVLILLMALSVKLALEVDVLNIYIAPLCILPIVVRTFYDARLALLLHIVSVFMLAFIVPSAFEFVFLHSFAGILLLYGMRSLSRRSQFFNAALVIFISYAATYLGLNIIQEGSFQGIHWNTYAWFGGNAVLSMLAFPLIYFFERSFGFVSEVSLLEISDSNNVLLREMSEKAPGTFQHTLQVANLAEEAIRTIGGNALLVRAGALYHDIGKMEAPQFFTENQYTFNPHDDISDEESAKIIIRHVIRGIEMARKNRLPEEIIDFIRTHHGTTRVEYFYRNAINERGEDQVDPEAFTYPGPKPFSRETAVVMMADSVEAASRSLKDYSEESIEKLVEGIIRHQEKMGQFDNAAITFREISTVKQVFRRKLKNIYHARIAYPERESTDAPGTSPH